MINLEELLPEVYYRESRDFQFLARTFETLFNYAKTNVDLVINNPLSRNSDIKLLQLLAKTVGFDSKHNYNNNDLKAICSAFVELLKIKGSEEAIRKAIRILLNVQNINKNFELLRNPNDIYDLQILIPENLTDTILLEDLLDYILPAGFTYSFVYAEFSSDLGETVMTSNDKAKVWFNEYDNPNKLSQITKPSTENDKQPTIESINESGLSLTYTGVVTGGNRKPAGGE